MPFGELWPTVPPAPFEFRQFGGKERDAETGLDYFGARYYRGVSGRFTTVDPFMIVAAAIPDPQRWNRYAYGRNNPFVFIDPDGRDIISPLVFQTQAFTRQVGANLQALTKVAINVGRSLNSPGHMTPAAEAAFFEGPDTPAEASRMQAFEFLLSAVPIVGRAVSRTTATRVNLTSTAEFEPTHAMTMSGRAFNRLKADIAKNGIQEPVKFVEFNGRKYVVDGHHRLRAAKSLGIQNVPAQQVQLPFAGYKTPADLNFIYR